MKKALLLIAAVVALAACTKTVEVPVEVEVEKIIDILTLDAAQIQVPNKAVEQPIAFTTEDNWTISSDADWITFDKTSGAKGSNNVTMKIAKSEVYSTRTGRVTLSTTHNGTTKNTVFTVVQSEKEVFNTTKILNIGFKEQDITVEYSSNLTPEVNVVDGDWLTITQTKAEPVDGKIVVHAAKNEGDNSRVGSFTILAGNSLQTYKVLQASQFASSSTATAEFLGNKQDMYNEEKYEFKEFAQFGIKFETAEGLVILALNVDPEIEDITKVPTGKYAIDEFATHEAKTFSVKSAGLHEEYYTTVISDGEEMEVMSGVVTVEEEAGQYTIVATLADINGESRMYRFQGELVAQDASLGASVYVSGDMYSKNRGMYNTYYTTKAQETVLALHINKALPGSDTWLYYLDINLFTETTDGKIPVGKFTYNEPETVDGIDSANGKKNAPAGTFYISGASAFASAPDHYTSATVKEGTVPTLEITKQEDGRYTIAVEAVFAVLEYYYDEEYNYIEVGTTEVPYSAVFNDVYTDELPLGLQPAPDGDAVMSSIMSASYPAFWYGDKFNTNCHVFQFALQYVNYTYNFYLAVNVDDPSWVFEANYLTTQYCANPISDGTYTYSATPAANTLIRVKNYHRVQNTYTGHIYDITGGSITLNGGFVTYDLTVAYGEETYHLTGTHAAQTMYSRNYSSRNLTLD